MIALWFSRGKDATHCLERADGEDVSQTNGDRSGWLDEYALTGACAVEPGTFATCGFTGDTCRGNGRSTEQATKVFHQLLPAVFAHARTGQYRGESLGN